MSFISYHKVSSIPKSNFIKCYAPYNSNGSLECRKDAPTIQGKRRALTNTTDISLNLCNWWAMV